RFGSRVSIVSDYNFDVNPSTIDGQADPSVVETQQCLIVVKKITNVPDPSLKEDERTLKSEIINSA
ncbi:hypothetical protein PFISCL1PPCAC_25563, partial [Pristionchus fissidentatus]